MTGMVGSVTRQRYDELVKLGRDWVETMSGVQWQLGDASLKIEPMRSYGGTNPSGSEELFTVSEAIRMFAEDVVRHEAPHNRVEMKGLHRLAVAAVR
jgi:hypothetical protein